MTLTELKYIVAVARERHFGRAAEACFVSQPTLSVAIKKLEDELSVQIFERGTSEVSVTPLGEQIVTQAQRVLEQTLAIKEIAKQGKDPLVVFPKSLIKDYEFLRTTPDGLNKRIAIWNAFKAA